MALNKEFKVKKGISVEAGTHVGLLLSIIHLGVQKIEYAGEVSYKDQVLLVFELPDTTLEDGRPITISKRETHSVGKKSNLLKAVKALNGGKDVAREGILYEILIGKPVMLELKENSKKTGVNVAGYMPVPDVLKKTLKPLVNEAKLYLDVEKISDKELEALPEWVRKVINERVKEDDPVDPGVDY
jgi:hypothetical protein